MKATDQNSSSSILFNIFEIQFVNLSYKSIIDKLKFIGNFNLINDTFYISTKLTKEKIINHFAIQNIKKIKTINKQNHTSINNIACQQWCQNTFLENDKLIFELNNQENLNKLNKDLDYLLSFKTKEELQAFLIKQVYDTKNIKGGGDVGTTKTTENK